MFETESFLWYSGYKGRACLLSANDDPSQDYCRMDYWYWKGTGPLVTEGEPYIGKKRKKVQINSTVGHFEVTKYKNLERWMV